MGPNKLIEAIVGTYVREDGIGHPNYNGHPQATHSPRFMRAATEMPTGAWLALKADRLCLHTYRLVTSGYSLIFHAAKRFCVVGMDLPEGAGADTELTMEGNVIETHGRSKELIC